jgi:hypothetical protein
METRWALLLFLALAASRAAGLLLPQIFGDNMVLQTPTDGGRPASIFGYAAPGDTVTVNMTIAGALTQYRATADAVTGRWSVVVAPRAGDDPAPSGVDFSVAASSEAGAPPATIRNASFGEVLLCNGQSNLVLSVAAASNPVGRPAPPSPQLQHATWPDISLFSVVSTNSSAPTRDLPAYVNRSATPCTWGYVANMTPPQQLVCQQWQVARPGVTDFFSAECFYTAYHLVQSGAIPAGRRVGLVQSAYSGTMMELWVPPEALQGCPAKPSAAAAPAWAAAAAAPWVPGCIGANTTSCLWNDMIYPLVGLGLRAVVHNQIESNMGDSFEYYACVFQNMVAAWRARWGIGDFPWLTTGLGDQGFSPDQGGKNVGFPAYVATPRDGQAAILPGRYPGVSRTPLGGLVSAYDLGDRVGNPNGGWDVHARFKGEVGRRMALALSNATRLGAPADGSPVDWNGPTVASARLLPGGATIALVWQAPAGVYANWTQDAWEGCDGAVAKDVFQVASWTAGANFSRSGAWVNTTWQWEEASATVLLTPVSADPRGQPWLVVRYAASLWPQCAFYSHSNAVPALAFSDQAIAQL